jgi:superfamily II DNA/RNA helicase
MAIDPLKLTAAIRGSYNRYLTTAFRLRNQNLQELFYGAVEAFNFLNGPILEATPPFQDGCTIKKLVEERIFEPQFEKLLYSAFPYLEVNALYQHQEKALRKILAGRNVVIASGTGSGKTESFLIPILNHLFAEHRKGQLTPGVRALLLYPMNALANDQLRRLEDIAIALANSHPDFNMTFGRYVGDTPEKKAEGENKFRLANPGKEPVKGELLSREEMRENPPHVLLTNYAMLEYLLLRPYDSPFFDGNNAKHWKYLVLDEAHIYNGASGIEMGMLIRRLKDRVSSEGKGHLRCIATSATLGNEDRDLPEVAKFAANLFDEPFEWVDADDQKQDVVKGVRQKSFEIKSSAFPLLLYGELDQLIKNPSRQDELLPKIENCCRVQGIESTVISKAKEAAGGDPKKFLYELLSRDMRVAELKRLLEDDGATKLEECVKKLLKVFDPSAEDKQSVVSLVNLAVWAHDNKSGLPLLPARYHLFVRAPEGMFVALYPTNNSRLFLERRELTEEGYAVFDLATCRRCGQEYLIGDIVGGKLKHPFSELETRRKNRYFLLWTGEKDFEEDEDEEVAVPEAVSMKGKTLNLCIRCGSVYEDADKCGCSDDTNTIRTIIEVVPKGDTLNVCSRCGLRSVNIVREFVFQQDAPTAVLATALFENLEKKNQKEKKILAFSDSRQDAAFFASYLDYTYSRLLYRRLIVEVLNKNRHITDYRLQTLCDDFVRVADEHKLFDESLDERQKKKEAWGWIIQEFCALDRRICLEGVGLLSFRIIPPDGWNPPEELLTDPWNLTREECLHLYQVLFDTLRYNKAITFPPDAPDPSDEIFARFNRNKKYWFRSEGSDSKNGIYAFIPARQSVRLDFITKLGEQVTGEKPSIQKCKELLGIIWNDVRANWVGKQVFQYSDNRLGAISQLDYRYWQIVEEGSKQPFFICSTCGFVGWTNIRGICPTFGCNGRLEPSHSSAWQTYLQRNHYRHVYTHLPLTRLIAEEHTAQLTQDEASKIQQQFIKGEINLLSCSTTFELGVDLGELESIFLRNVPPEPSNYIQRSGRAGRRLDSIGFTLTFAQLRSHDLTYFKEPQKMVQGEIPPPSVEIRNEKIVRRHLHSVVLSKFFREYQDYFGNVDSFFRLVSNGTPGLDLVRKYLEQRPAPVMESLKRILPHNLAEFFQVENWGWVKDFVGEGGALEVADAKIRDEYNNLEDFYRRKEEQWKNAQNQSVRNRLNADMNWAHDRVEEIRKRLLIDYLAGNTVIPKYGFPVDVVELTLYSHIPETKKVQLERDLRIALSEFAPGSQLVAKGYLWESSGIRVIRNKAWPMQWYAICSNCQRFNLQEATIDETPPSMTCRNCGSALSRNDTKRFITPVFGFVTSRDVAPKKPGESRPKKEFSTRPYFFDYSAPQEAIFSFGDLTLKCRYSSDGQLAVICRGRKGGGFFICFDCGRSRPERQLGHHKKPNGDPCHSPLKGAFHLGHKYKTDVLSVSLERYKPPSSPMDEGFWFSLLFALLEGTSSVLGIRRQDLDGCLYPLDRQIALILFDNVPGGAGHVKRLMQQRTLADVLANALHRVKYCSGCGPETSCYGCLRNYQNQFCHEKLKRGLVSDFLENNLSLT